MNKRIPTLISGIVSLICISTVFAQSGQPASTEGQDLVLPRFEDATALTNDQTGLRVEERRFENRLDSVTVHRGEDGLQDHYNLNDPDIERRDGGIVEGGAMRTWRLGGRKK